MATTLRLTSEIGAAIADAVRSGTPLDTAADRAGVSRSQVYIWMQAAETGLWGDGNQVAEASKPTLVEFADAIRRARADHMAQMVAAIQECATTPNAKTGVPDWRAADAMLSKHPSYRKVWHEERHVEVTQQGTVSHEHTLVRALEPDALEAAYRSLEALPDARAADG